MMSTGCEYSIGQCRCDGWKTDDSTFNTGAEALLISRPLIYQSLNLDDDLPLTPNTDWSNWWSIFPRIHWRYQLISLKKRWRRVQELVRHFWHTCSWLREWIPGLNSRIKWLREERDIQTGYVVLVISPHHPMWTLRPLGRIIEVHQGKDGP